MDLSPSSRFNWRDLLRPGCLLGISGMVLLSLCVLKYAWSHHGVDVVADPEQALAVGSSVKTMVWMVLGVGLTLLGALLSFLDFRGR